VASGSQALHVSIAPPRSPQNGFQAIKKGLNAICIPMQVPEAALSAARESYSLTPIDRLLITMPYTFTAFEYCATSLDRARLFGVVSVMRRNADGSWYGDMLDGLAFV
jgi:shikimate dehydrogenase